MNVVPTDFEGLFILEPIIHEDDRGYFMESYNQNVFHKNFPDIFFVQQNESQSNYGVLRGLHFQIPPYAQSKLVRVVKGEVLDVVVDLRLNSDTYGKFGKFILSEKNKRQLLIPVGFAHGFLTISKSAIFSYMVDSYYSKNHESGFIWNDAAVGIDWEIPKQEVQISEKDNALPKLKELVLPKSW